MPDDFLWLGLEAVKKQLTPQVLNSKVPILLLGEIGTGKTQIARWIHQQSNRSQVRVQELNCAAIPETMVESELFGHERGAFTDARKDRKGRFTLADHGTLFLDEIGELRSDLQAKLLKVLESETFRPLGAESDLTVDVRVICATNRSLREMVRQGTFRGDLLSRINTITLTVPPLRERRAAIGPLFKHLLAKHYSVSNEEPPEVGPDAMQLLEARPWPENSRELESVARLLPLYCPQSQLIRAEDIKRLPTDHDQQVREHLHDDRPLEENDDQVESEFDANMVQFVDQICGVAGLVSADERALVQMLAQAMTSAPGWQHPESPACSKERTRLIRSVVLKNDWPLLRPLQAAFASVFAWDLARLGETPSLTALKSRYVGSFSKGKEIPFVFRDVVTWLDVLYPNGATGRRLRQPRSKSIPRDDGSLG